jgi:hypothetical protein
MKIKYITLTKMPEHEVVGVEITDVIYCCHEMMESIKEGFVEISKENPPYLEFDTDGRWIENAKYCYHCGAKLELIRGGY